VGARWDPRRSAGATFSSSGSIVLVSLALERFGVELRLFEITHDHQATRSLWASRPYTAIRLSNMEGPPRAGWSHVSIELTDVVQQHAA